MRRTFRPRGCRGFTLLEVMAALSVFLIGIVSVLALLTAGTRLHQESQNMGITADVSEEVLLLCSRELAESTTAGGAAQGLPSSGGVKPLPRRPDLSYEWTVKAAEDGGLYLLLADVTWMEAGKPRRLTLEKVLPRLQSPSVDARRMVTGKRS